jgi:hypothetical protein
MAHMSDHFVAGPLDRRHIAQAFPVINMDVPGLTIDRWRAVARARVRSVPHGGLGGPRGILSARNPAGYIHGLVIYEITDDLQHGRAFIASHLVTVRSAGSGEIVSALIGAMEKTARAYDCTSLRATLPMPAQAGASTHGWDDPWLIRRFRRAGFEVRMIPVVCRSYGAWPLSHVLSKAQSEA